MHIVLGGGGKGMRIVQHAGEFEEMLGVAREESRKHFKDEDVLLERCEHGLGCIRHCSFCSSSSFFTRHRPPQTTTTATTNKKTLTTATATLATKTI